MLLISTDYFGLMSLCGVMCPSLTLIITLLVYAGRIITGLCVLVLAAPHRCCSRPRPREPVFNNETLPCRCQSKHSITLPPLISLPVCLVSFSFSLCAQETRVCCIPDPGVARHQGGEEMHPELPQTQTLYKTCRLTHEPWQSASTQLQPSSRFPLTSTVTTLTLELQLL